MIFTTITNGEGDAMRQLERKDAGTPAKTAAKGAAKTADKPAARKREAQLVLSNGEMGEGARLGLSLVGSGLTALTIGVLEGLARKDKAKWWRDLAPVKRGLVLMAFAVVAGLIARHRRKTGHHKSGCALEAAAIGAWTVATIYFTEAGFEDADAELGALRDRDVGDVGVDELKAIDKKIDDDIRDAARRLRELAEEERAAAGREERREADDDELGLLAYHGDAGMDEDDDEDIF